MRNIPSVNDLKAYFHKAVNYVQNTEHGILYLVGCLCLLVCGIGLLFCLKRKRR